MSTRVRNWNRWIEAGVDASRRLLVALNAERALDSKAGTFINPYADRTKITLIMGALEMAEVINPDGAWQLSKHALCFKMEKAINARLKTINPFLKHLTGNWFGKQTKQALEYHAWLPFFAGFFVDLRKTAFANNDYLQKVQDCTQTRISEIGELQKKLDATPEGSRERLEAKNALDERRDALSAFMHQQDLQQRDRTSDGFFSVQDTEGPSHSNTGVRVSGRPLLEYKEEFERGDPLSDERINCSSGNKRSRTNTSFAETTSSKKAKMIELEDIGAKRERARAQRKMTGVEAAEASFSSSLMQRVKGELDASNKQFMSEYRREAAKEQKERDERFETMMNVLTGLNTRIIQMEQNFIVPMHDPQQLPPQLAENLVSTSSTVTVTNMDSEVSMITDHNTQM